MRQSVMRCISRQNDHQPTGTADSYLLSAVNQTVKPYVGGFPLHNPQDYVYSKSCISRHIDAFIAVGARPAALSR